MLRNGITVRVAVVICLATSLLPANSVSGVSETVPTGNVSVGAAREFLNELTVRISRDRIAPTKASRLYANVAYAMFLASAEPNDPIFDALLTPPKLPLRGTNVDPFVAALSAGASVARNVFLVPTARTAFGEVRDRLLHRITRDLAADVERESINYGRTVADAVIARADSDGFEDSKKIMVPEVSGPGIWVPTQPGFQPAIDPGWGTLTTFFINTKKCALPAPPKAGPKDSPFLVEAGMVAAVAAALTEEQKTIARFWDDSRGRTGTPAGHWILLALMGAEQNNKNAVETIRIVAHTMLAIADAFIVNFGVKYKYMVERPITVLERNNPNWSSYLPTPAFPEYPSGHSTISKAAADVLSSYLGQQSFTDPGYGMTEESRNKFEVSPRIFESFADAAAEASISRLYGGLHYEMGLSAGVTLGSCIAKMALR